MSAKPGPDDGDADESETTAEPVDESETTAEPVDESETTAGRESDGTADRPDSDEFGWRGWILTAALLISVLVIPGIIYAYPYAAGSFGLTFFATYLVLPLIPAALLGLIAVWSMSTAVGRSEATGDRDSR